MGFFKRAASAINHADPVTDLVVAVDPSIRRVRKLEERGATANGVITGVAFSFADDVTQREYAVALVGVDGSPRIGVRAQGDETPRLRLGVPVVTKVDGNRGIFDWDQMAAAWGLADRFLAQTALRRPPADGVVDTALDSRVRRHLKRWTATPATIVSLERKSVLGMVTMNWNITLRLPDGSTALSKGDAVPSYAMWFAVPGAVVPAVVDPQDTTKASIDWPRFAVSQFDTAGFDDDPPPGSVAAEVEQQPYATPPSVSVSVVSPPSTPVAGVIDASGAPVALDATMQSWVDAYKGGFLGQKDFDRSLRDWQAAGMCTAAQVEAARAAVS